ncbi:hypothetical protein TNCV_4768631 [Trichonephila clavipes]|nr:hypothetical protein TNCV_4768631 [Trichonephila clavipes]
MRTERILVTLAFSSYFWTCDPKGIRERKRSSAIHSLCRTVNSVILFNRPGDRGNLVVNGTNTWQACQEFEPSTAEDPSFRGGLRTLSTSRLKCFPMGVVRKQRERERERVPAQVSSSSFNSGSKWPPTKALEKQKS